LAVFRLPLRLYRRGWGWLLGDTFLLLVHAGRKTGKPYSTVAMALSYPRDFASTRPFVSLWPLSSGHQPTRGEEHD
jgi:hypothetical protein